MSEGDGHGHQDTPITAVLRRQPRLGLRHFVAQTACIIARAYQPRTIVQEVKTFIFY